MALVQSCDLWVKANLKETQLRRLRPGQPVSIHVDALGSDFAGYVKSIAPATASEFSLLPAENASGNFVKVVQRIPVRIEFKANQDRSRLRPGMSVEVKVWVKHE